MGKSYKKNPIEIYGVDGFPEGKMIQNEHYNYRSRVFTYQRDSTSN